MRRLILFPLHLRSAILILATWIKLYVARKKSWPGSIALTALIIASSNAAFSVWNFLHYDFNPWPYLPPWKDTEILNFGLLFLSAPVGMIVAFMQVYAVPQVG